MRRSSVLIFPIQLVFPAAAFILLFNYLKNTLAYFYAA
jgi:hypothetical protein